MDTDHRRNQLSEMESVRIAYLFADVDLLPSIEKSLILWFKPPLNGAQVASEDGAQGFTERKDYATRFQNKGDQPMGKPVCVALPLEIDKAVRSLSGGARSEWLRRVITEAAQRELIETENHE